MGKYTCFPISIPRILPINLYTLNWFTRPMQHHMCYTERSTCLLIYVHCVIQILWGPICTCSLTAQLSANFGIRCFLWSQNFAIGLFLNIPIFVCWMMILTLIWIFTNVVQLQRSYQRSATAAKKVIFLNLVWTQISGWQNVAYRIKKILHC